MFLSSIHSGESEEAGWYMTSLKTAVASAGRAMAAMARRETPVRNGAQRAEREGAMDLMGRGLRVDRVEAAVSGSSVL